MVIVLEKHTTCTKHDYSQPSHAVTMAQSNNGECKREIQSQFHIRSKRKHAKLSKNSSSVCQSEVINQFTSDVKTSATM